MKTYRVTVLQTVDVVLDETKFTETYLSDFRETFYPFQTIEDHAEHLGQLVARGLADKYSRCIEGYGAPAEVGFDARILDAETEVRCLGEVGPDPRRGPEAQ